MRQSCSRRSLWTGLKWSCHHQKKSASSYLSRRCVKSHTYVFFISPSVYLLDCGSNLNSVNVARNCWIHTGTKTTRRRKWMLIEPQVTRMVACVFICDLCPFFFSGGPGARMPTLQCHPDAASPPVVHFHHPGRGKCRSRLRPGGDWGSHEDSGDQHSVSGRLAHPGVRLQSSATAEHRPVPWGRRLRSQVEVHGQHLRSVTVVLILQQKNNL